MTTIELTFPAGRFHATPWGRHVNEGAVEWPPSPHRLLRALVATWKRKADHLEEATVRGLLEALCEPPEYALPPATFGHTRHYMPWFKKGPGDKTLIFDSFVAVDKESPLKIVWRNVELTTDQQVALAELLPLLGTLGRSESWCEARLLDVAAGSSSLAAINCRPLNGDVPIGEVVRVLGVDSATAFTNENNPPHDSKNVRGTAKSTVVTPIYDPDWHLCMETLWMHERRLSMPPGTRWVNYDRPKEALAPPKTRLRRPLERPAMQVARFTLDSAVLPLITDTLRIAEAARIALMSRHGWITREGDTKGKSPVFSGKDANGLPIADHSHAYFLPTDEDGDGRIDHLTVIASAGFGSGELRAIDTLRQIKTKDTENSGHPLGVILTGLGRLDEFTPGPLKHALTWVSTTPYLSHRHPKTRGRKKDRPVELASHAAFTEARLREDIARLLERRDDLKDIPLEQINITPCVDENGVFRLGKRRHRPIEFQRFRQKHGDDGGKRLCGAFAIEFPRAVRGPISLGHSCHYGMGLFLPQIHPSH